MNTTIYFKKVKIIKIGKFNHLINTLVFFLTCKLKLHFNTYVIFYLNNTLIFSLTCGLNLFIYFLSNTHVIFCFILFFSKICNILFK
jgi:hypothetical protein